MNRVIEDAIEGHTRTLHILLAHKLDDIKKNESV
jgi:hypothetical protein